MRITSRPKIKNAVIIDAAMGIDLFSPVAIIGNAPIEGMVIAILGDEVVCISKKRLASPALVRVAAGLASDYKGGDENGDCGGFCCAWGDPVCPVLPRRRKPAEGAGR